MSEEKKEGCCSTGKSSCCGIKKIIIGVVLALLIFACGYIFGSGHCPFAGEQKTCPMMKK
ncbi:MAG: hypothetical protein HQL15_01200 [Candidatus Omnitrophica bacterium]|nr:hypothetical protein [Candidatus Omnitrophota bacterium]